MLDSISSFCEVYVCDPSAPLEVSLGVVGLVEVTGVFSRNPCYHVGVLKEGR